MEDPTKLSDEEKAFRQAIIEEPDDDGIRLIYADWLEEQGNPRGEFIRLQIELEHVESTDSRRAEYLDREQEMLQEHREEWEPTKPKKHGHQCHHFKRGFVEPLRPGWLSPEEIEEQWKWSPVRELMLRDENRSQLSDWGKSPFLQRVRVLNLNANVDFPARDCSSLLTSEHLVNLKEIHASEMRFSGTESIEALTTNEALSSLEHVCLSFPEGFSSRWLELLANATSFQNLKSFVLNNTELGNVGAQIIADGRAWKRLEHLGLSNCRIGAPGIASLAKAVWLKSLTGLDLSANPISNLGAETLFQSKHLANLKTLHLWNCKLGRSTAMDLASSPSKPRLKELYLGGNHLGREGAKALANTPHLADLEILDLTRNEIADEGAKSLGESPYLRNLRELNLSTNGLRVFGVKDLIKSGALSHVHTLNLNSNMLTERGLQVIARCEHLPELVVLGMHNTHQGMEGIRDLTQFTNLPRLRHLDLSKNDLDDEAFSLLCRSDFAKQLIELKLYENDDTLKCLPSLMELSKSTKLRLLHWSRIVPEEVCENLRKHFGNRLHPSPTEEIPF